jgi:hypothetical protein
VYSSVVNAAQTRTVHNTRDRNLFVNPEKTSRLPEAVTFLNCTRAIPGSNFDCCTEYARVFFVCFFSISPGYCRGITLNMADGSGQFLSRPSQFNYSM